MPVFVFKNSLNQPGLQSRPFLSATGSDSFFPRKTTALTKQERCEPKNFTYSNASFYLKKLTHKHPDLFTWCFH